MCSVPPAAVSGSDEHVSSVKMRIGVVLSLILARRLASRAGISCEVPAGLPLLDSSKILDKSL